jgi:hypothetical protein
LKSVCIPFPQLSIRLINPLALYGKPYIAAAKDTWRLFKDRGIDALINDSLVSMSQSFSRPPTVPA